MKILNEATAVALNIERRGDDGSLIIPTSLKYRVDCVTNNQPVTDWATLTPAATTTVVIPAASNAIIESAHQVRRTDFDDIFEIYCDQLYGGEKPVVIFHRDLSQFVKSCERGRIGESRVAA